MLIKTNFSQLLRTPRGILALNTYQTKVLSYNPYAYWPLTEVSGMVANCLVNSGQDGIYLGLTLNDTTFLDESPAPYFDGINDCVDILSATLNSAMQGNIDEGAFLIWWKKPNWNSEIRSVFDLRTISDNDHIMLSTTNTVGQIEHLQKADGAPASYNYITSQPTDWQVTMITWSKSNNYWKVYLAGTEIYATTYIGDWTGVLALGSIGSNYSGNGKFWQGNIANVALFNTEKLAIDATDLAAIN